MDTQQTDAALSIAEAAALLHVHPITVRRLIRRGVLPAGKVGGQYRIRRSHAEALLADR